MAKQLNIDMRFNADTSGARQQIQLLQTQLNQLASGTTGTQNLPITSSLIQAQQAARQLGTALREAISAETGKLDLSKFNEQLAKSKMTLKDYGRQLNLLGVDGNKAFLQLSQSIIETEAPLRRSSALMAQFSTTLKNTARWQLSSSLLHGFISSISTAYNYSKDLNENLNNIRIVTGYNIDKMSEFADEANKAAKALSTTTNEYAKGSLIYYQQGLSDSEVAERTAITVKLAQVSQQTAEETSDQLTAIWSNFSDGSDSLERYADVLTKLGAATASSTDEIAGGVEKFAGIAKTIGLSYDYAAAALATLTANTRQSEEVVGTALKTIFARMESLSLEGSVEEDGVTTTLTQYTQALEQVGVHIYDANGALKDMDDILDDTAIKWKTLNRDQQAALAKSVAG